MADIFSFYECKEAAYIMNHAEIATRAGASASAACLSKSGERMPTVTKAQGKFMKAYRNGQGG